MHDLLGGKQKRPAVRTFPAPREEEPAARRIQVCRRSSCPEETRQTEKVLDLYVRLSFRLEESFPDREVASAQKEICSL
ncbi:DExH-box ATP-dependent RNA helicase DExH16 [Nymphaea thermarum]|nr:DExH-box ATP-dependent RNA helicase DExH16 [Nymphaea thermarum]